MLDKDLIIFSTFLALATAITYACYIILLYTNTTVGFILTSYIMFLFIKAMTKILDYINNHINTVTNNNNNKSIP